MSVILECLRRIAHILRPHYAYHCAICIMAIEETGI